MKIQKNMVIEILSKEIFISGDKILEHLSITINNKNRLNLASVLRKCNTVEKKYQYINNKLINVYKLK